jgi:hypothetical protein
VLGFRYPEDGEQDPDAEPGGPGVDRRRREPAAGVAGQRPRRGVPDGAPRRAGDEARVRHGRHERRRTDVPLVTVESPLEMFALIDPRTRQVRAALRRWTDEYDFATQTVRSSTRRCTCRTRRPGSTAARTAGGRSAATAHGRPAAGRRADQPRPARRPVRPLRAHPGAAVAVGRGEQDRHGHDGGRPSSTRSRCARCSASARRTSRTRPATGCRSCRSHGQAAGRAGRRPRQEPVTAHEFASSR